MSKYIKRIIDPRTAVRALIDPVGAAEGVRKGVAPISGKTLLGFAADPGGILGLNKYGLGQTTGQIPVPGASQGGGSSAPAGAVPTGNPSYPGFQPNPFNAPGKYNQQALGLMGSVPPSGAGGAPGQPSVPLGTNTPYSTMPNPSGLDPFRVIPGNGVPGNPPLLPIAPGSGAYRPGADQPRLLPGPVNTGQPNMQIPTPVNPSRPLDLEELKRRIAGGASVNPYVRTLLR